MKSILVRAVAILALGLALHAPRLGRAELENEEGRRALPPREMLESGDYVMPTVFGEPYLAKPPGYYYAVVVSAVLLERFGPERIEAASPAEERSGWSPPEHGPVSPLAVRLPSLIAALGCALVLLIAGQAWGSGAISPSSGEREGKLEASKSEAGTLAAIFFLFAPNLARKVRLGEIEVALSAACFLAGVLLWFSARGPRWRPGLTVAGGLALGVAGLFKGPVALLFALPAGLAAAGLRRPGRAAGVLALGTAVGVALAALWVVPLLARFSDRAELLAFWSSEIARDPEPGLVAFFSDRWRLVGGSLIGWLPASGLVIYGLVRRFGAGVGAVLWCIALPALVLFFWPGVRARYAMPLLPWIALAGGLVASDLIQRRRAAGRPGVARPVVLAFGFLIAARGVQLFVLEPPREDRARRIESAQRLDELVGERLWVDEPYAFKTLYYMRRDVRWASRPDVVSSGEILLRGPFASGELPEEEWELLDTEIPTPKFEWVKLWRRR